MVEINKLIELRKELHKYPELSGKESNTAKIITRFIKAYNPDEIIDNIGGYGLTFIFKGKESGSTVLFRCELDALPIIETNTFSHKSNNQGVSHKCGHDGHMAIIAGIGNYIHKNPIQFGKVVLLFQPAEETGQGAEAVVNDEKYKKIGVDYVFALHNLPKYKFGNVLVKHNNFASASKGMIINLKGKTSHAGNPENGINPDVAISKIISGFHAIKKSIDFNDFVLITTIHIKLGEIAFGTSAGEAAIMFTLRAYRNDDMKLLTQKCEHLVKTVCLEEKLTNEIAYTEEFPAVFNDENCVRKIENAARNAKQNIEYIENAFRWSEDFAHFTLKHPGALFGLGSGENQPQLHNPDYDFPDDLIEIGRKVFIEIMKQYNY